MSIRSKKQKELYIGYTVDLKKRIREHNQGKNKASKPYLPWVLIYYEACLSKEDAIRRENYLKTTQGRRLLWMRLKEYLYRHPL